MPCVVVERVWEEPAEFAAIQAIEDRGAWRLEMHAVRFVRSYSSADGRRMICIYEAPDAESVRAAQHQAGMPLTRVWTATILELLPAQLVPPAGRTPGSRELVVVERTFPEPLDAAEHAAGAARMEGCMRLHDVEYLRAHLSLDRRRLVCIFRGPDAESVRIANRQAEAPFDRAWNATLHEA
jgi:hypothetical protein